MPYQRALEGVFLEAVKLIGAKPGHNTIAFVHDDGPDFEDLRQCYIGFLEANPRTAKHMVGFQPLNDKLHPPLQLADMIANLTLETAEKWLVQKRPVLLENEMRESIGKLGVWSEHYMLSVLKRNLIRFGKPLSFDLQREEYG